jgi:hypothetical protein
MFLDVSAAWQRNFITWPSLISRLCCSRPECCGRCPFRVSCLITRQPGSARTSDSAVLTPGKWEQTLLSDERIELPTNARAARSDVDSGPSAASQPQVAQIMRG